MDENTEGKVATAPQAAGVIGGNLLLGGLCSFGASAIFATLWRSVKDEGRDTTELDRKAAGWMQRHQRPGWTELARGLAWSGSPLVMITLAASGACAGLIKRRVRGAAWTFPLAILGGGVIIQGIKSIYKRPRPSFFTPLLKETGYSFPSGHSLIAITVYGLMGYFGHGFVKGRAARGTLTTGTATMIGLIGASRVYVGVHYVTDVLAGWTAGFPWLMTCIALHEVLARHVKGAGNPLIPDAPANPIAQAIIK